MASSLAVVTTGTDKEKDLLETAATFSECGDGDLLVLEIASPDDYNDVLDTMDTIGQVEDTSYGKDDVRRALKKTADDAVAELESDVPIEVMIRIVDDDERADAILEVAREHDCEHVFLVGQRRSPTGKALFGDVTQKVILNFDGEITLSMV